MLALQACLAEKRAPYALWHCYFGIDNEMFCGRRPLIPTLLPEGEGIVSPRPSGERVQG